MNDEFGRQAAAIVSENQHLRVKSDNDDITIRLLKEQYASLSDSVDGMRSDFERKVHRAETERDKAVVAYKEMESLLLQSANIITQALRARVGDATPEKMPGRPLASIRDDRLPIARLAE